MWFNLTECLTLVLLTLRYTLKTALVIKNNACESMMVVIKNSNENIDNVNNDNNSNFITFKDISIGNDKRMSV